MLNCKYCGKESNKPNLNSLRSHERLCKSNPNKQISSFENKEIQKICQNKRKNQFQKAKEDGMIYIISDETREKLRISGGIGSRKYFSDHNNRKKHSDIMREVVKQNPDSYSKNNVCGRVKNIHYNGCVLKGSWELKVAKWLDYQNIKWESEVNPQPYFWKNSYHTYFPDFYLPDLNVYIEVKGYKRERDSAKWNQFTGILYVIDINTIHKLETLILENITKIYGSVVK